MTAYLLPRRRCRLALLGLLLLPLLPLRVSLLLGGQAGGLFLCQRTPCRLSRRPGRLFLGGSRRLRFLCNLVALFLLGGAQLLLARALLFLLLLPLLSPRLSARMFMR